jgi:hypothetical protein
MPADTVEGVFAPTLWDWIAENYQLEAVVTFAPEATPFPDVDINPLIFMIRHAKPQESFYWATCVNPDTMQLRDWTLSRLRIRPHGDLLVCIRSLYEALKAGLSRPFTDIELRANKLSDFARVMRGVATGANEFFFMTAEQAKRLGIPSKFLTRAIGRTRDIEGDELTTEILEELDSKGRPTYLFSPDGRAIDEFPEPVREYLKLGEIKGLDRRPLIASRKPWYRMEKRLPPPIIFTYLGRRQTRFIANKAFAVPLTGFLCIYPAQGDLEFINRLLRVLRHPQTIANLRFVGKSYGGGAIKVEPRALERLPIAVHILKDAGLEPWSKQYHRVQTTLKRS